MFFVEIFFWLAAFIIFYTYIGYAIFLWLFLKIKGRKVRHHTLHFPEVTLVVPVYNENKIIEEKILNSLSLNYPADKLKILFVNDGSTDGTGKIIEENPSITYVHKKKREGKTAALNDAMKLVSTPIVVFSDANNLLHVDAIKTIVAPFVNRQIGGVSGEKKIIKNQNNIILSSAENIYWKYESFLKRIDSDFYSVVGADGGLFAIRTSLYEPVEDYVILDDFFISINVCQKGYLFTYDKDAYGIEPSSSTLKKEQKRKIRISAGCFQSLFMLKNLLNPFKNFKLFFLYFSHRVLRWVVCPLLLPLIFIINVLLFINNVHIVYSFFLCVQFLFYVLALAGWVGVKSKKVNPIFYLPYYFAFMNVSLYLGFWRWLNDKQSVLWEKSS